jgi:hypothetical protein
MILLLSFHWGEKGYASAERIYMVGNYYPVMALLVNLLVF